MKHRLVSLIADVATCRDRSILGKNLHFINDGKVQLRTLAMKELKKNRTAFYLKTVLDEIIKQYEIKSNQIYSITTNNGANMLKCVCLFSEEVVIEKTSNAEQPSCSSWQSNAEELSSDEDNSGTVNCIKVELFFRHPQFFAYQRSSSRKYVERCWVCCPHLTVGGKRRFKKIFFTRCC